MNQSVFPGFCCGFWLVGYDFVFAGTCGSFHSSRGSLLRGKYRHGPRHWTWTDVQDSCTTHQLYLECYYARRTPGNLIIRVLSN